jgi:hypothetical protein
MMEALLSMAPALVPVLLGIYALAFIAGGVYFLEQRVARIRDQFPGHGPIARLIAYTSLAIGLLAAIAVSGHYVNQGAQFRWGALVATAAGLGFWIVRLHTEMTLGSRIRDALLAILCLALTLLTGWWTSTMAGS